MRSMIVYGVAAAMWMLAGCGAAPDADTAADAAAEASTEQIALPPGADGALARLESSPRHGEWAMIPTSAGDSVRSWVVYPERGEAAPVVLVVHEIYGLTHWIRSVADALAAQGFIAIAPDLLSGMDVPADETGEPERDAAVAAVRSLDADVVHARLSDLAAWGMALPAAADRYGIVGFCWGGSTSFAHATRVPGLGASVVYYGSSPETEALAAVEAPVLGLYGGDDARVNSTIPPADSAMTALGKTYDYHIYEGAGHGFLRQQDGRDGANLAASEQGWPETINWFRTHLEAGATE